MCVLRSLVVELATMTRKETGLIDIGEVAVNEEEQQQMVGRLLAQGVDKITPEQRAWLMMSIGIERFGELMNADQRELKDH